jgi:hypothetical protein
VQTKSYLVVEDAEELDGEKVAGAKLTVEAVQVALEEKAATVRNSVSF